MAIASVSGDLTFVQAGSYSAEDIRKIVSNGLFGPGPIDDNSFNVTISSGLNLNFGVGAAFVRSPYDNLLYRVSQDGSPGQITIDTPNPSNPRLDQVILRIYDSAVDGTGQFMAQVETVNGAPTAGTTLDNRNGAVNLHSGLTGATAYLLLADVLVPAAGSTVTLRERRPIGQMGMVPAIATNVDQVSFIPHPGLAVVDATVVGNLGTGLGGTQSAVLMYLPRPIPATKIKWGFFAVNSITAGSNWNFGICDSSGFLIASTGAQAWSAVGANTVVRNVATLSVPYSGYIFDTGAYYVYFANGTGYNTSSYQTVYRAVMQGLNSAGNRIVTQAPNIAFLATSGGTTLVNNIVGSGGLLDSYAAGLNNAIIPTPVPTLSV